MSFRLLKQFLLYYPGRNDFVLLLQFLWLYNANESMSCEILQRVLTVDYLVPVSILTERDFLSIVQHEMNVLHL